MTTIIIDPRDLPIVQIGLVPEHFADCLGPVEISGSNFWVTFCRRMVPPGRNLEARVPIVRIGRELVGYRRNQLGDMIETARRMATGARVQ